MSKGPKVRITVYVDAYHAHDLVTRRSITGILLMFNNTPITWVSKHQKTVEISTYGSKLVASRYWNPKHIYQYNYQYEYKHL